MHIHVEGAEGKAKFDYENGEFVQKEVYNIKSNDLKRIKEVIDDNKEVIVKHWNRYFGG